tara:strand:- start:4461 stop:4742 length:282 start_codon:yes stop_codon:yes gene_type:complete
MPFNRWDTFNKWGSTSTVTIEIEGAGTGDYEISLFNIANLRTVIFNGVVSVVNGVFTVEIDAAENTIVVGVWLGDDFPNTGGGIYGITANPNN